MRQRVRIAGRYLVALAMLATLTWNAGAQDTTSRIQVHLLDSKTSQPMRNHYIGMAVLDVGKSEHEFYHGQTDTEGNAVFALHTPLPAFVEFGLHNGEITSDAEFDPSVIVQRGIVSPDKWHRHKPVATVPTPGELTIYGHDYPWHWWDRGER